MRKNKAGRRSTRNPSIESGQRWRQKNTGEIAAVVKADQFRVTFVRGVEAEQSIARALFEKHFEFESAAEARDEVVFSEARDRLLATHRRHTIVILCVEPRETQFCGGEVHGAPRSTV